MRAVPPSPFPLCGVIEGFYGAFYTFPERNDLIRFLGERGFNFYLYGPKNDRQHRMRWWEPYPPWVLDEFAGTIAVAREVGIEFCYAISFGVPLNYASPGDFALITDKFHEFYRRGCRSFAVLYDDLTEHFADEESRRRYRSVADAHADCANRLLDWARSLDPACSLYVCPTEYSGTPPFSDYVQTLGAELHRDIGIFYTGPDVCARSISRADVDAYTAALGRQPILWDNYPVNDAMMRGELHLGPLLHRDPWLAESVAGYAANPMNQKEASKIALLTIADYLWDPQGYDPAASWREALLDVGEIDSFQALARFAENSLHSCLHREEAPEMDRLVTAVLDCLHQGESVSSSPAVTALQGYFDSLDESCYHLKNRMRNHALRANLLPWIEALEEKLWLGRRALATLAALQSGADPRGPFRGMEELLNESRTNPKHIGGTAILALGEYVEHEMSARGHRLPATTAATVDALDPAGLTPERSPDAGPVLETGTGSD
jgi:hyaluronoglucosaminidase